MAATAGRVAIAIAGPGGEGMRSELVAALPVGVEAVPIPRTDAIEIAGLADALARQRLDDQAFATGEAKRRPMLIRKLHKASRAIGADALIAGTLNSAGHKGPGELQLIVVLSSKDDATFDEAIPLKKAAAARARQLRHLLSVALDGVAGESEATADNEVNTPSENEFSEKPKDAPTGVHASVTDALLVGFGGLDFGGRQVHYNQRITNANLRPYDLPQGLLLPVTPGAALSVELYPLAKARFERAPWSVARDIGITSHVGYNLAKAQVGADTLKTTWYAWEANLRLRLHLGDRGSSTIIGLEGGVGRQVFAFKDNPAIADILPGVDYHYLRAGGDCRIPVGKFAAIAGLAYRHLLHTTGPTGATILAAGSVGEHFPRAEIAGLDAHVSGALPLAKNVEARIVLSYIRYWASFHSRPGDTYIAGGALEQFVYADLGIAAFF
jgi:hypothetical protein